MYCFRHYQSSPYCLLKSHGCTGMVSIWHYPLSYSYLNYQCDIIWWLFQDADITSFLTQAMITMYKASNHILSIQLCGLAVNRDGRSVIHTGHLIFDPINSLKKVYPPPPRSPSPPPNIAFLKVHGGNQHKLSQYKIVKYSNGRRYCALNVLSYRETLKVLSDTETRWRNII